MRVLTFATVALVVALSATANAATRYVSTTGNDANAGTIDAPFRTLGKASAVAKPGDTVNVRGGVYSGPVSIAAKGTASAPIVFRSAPGESAVIDGTGAPADKPLVTLYRTDHVVFSGFEVRNAPQIGISGYATSNTTVAGNTIHGSVRNAIYFGYSSFGSSTGVTIEGNTVYGNVLENQYRTLNGGWAGAVVVARTDGARVLANRVYSNDGEGIIALLSDNVLVQDNEVYDNFSVNVYLDNAQSTTVDRNFIYSTGNSRYYRFGFPAVGIGNANETYSDANPSSGLTITNNIVVNTRWGFYYGSYESGGGLKSTIVANNTFYRASEAIIHISNGPHAGNAIENNIFHQVGGTGPVVLGGGITFRANNWYGTNAGAAAGAGDVIGDPLFVKAGGLRADDYKLSLLSVAIHRGVDNPAVKTDYWGAPRSPSIDIGAHEQSLPLGSSSPAAPPPEEIDTEAPTVPAGFEVMSTTYDSVSIAWLASSDNLAVTAYEVYRDGALIGTTRLPSWTDTSLQRNTEYSYHFVAYDAAGNRSAASATVSVKTLGGKRRAAR